MFVSWPPTAQKLEAQQKAAETAGLQADATHHQAAAERLREHVLRTEQQKSALAAEDLSKMEVAVPELYR